MSGGYSTQSFMTGLADGLNLGNGLYDRQRQIKREDRADAIAEEDRTRRMGLEDYQLARQKKQDDDADEDRQKLQLMNDMLREVRSSYETNTPLSEDFGTRYSLLGADRLSNPGWNDANIQAGKALEGAYQSGSFGSPESVSALNAMLGPELAERQKADGLTRRVAGVRKVSANGNLVVELEVTDKDGKSYKAPLTRDGSSDKNDQVIQLTPDRVNEWISAASAKAEMSHLLSASEGDPRKRADALNYIYTGNRLSALPEYDLKKGYGAGGGDQLYVIDKRTGAYRAVGAEKYVDRDGSVSGSGGSGGRKGQLVWDALKQFQKDAATDPEGAATAFEQMIGYPPQVAIQAMNAKRSLGDFNPITDQDFNLFLSGEVRAGEAESVRQPDQAAMPAQAQAAPARTPQPVVGEVTQRIRELEAKASDPELPDAARARFQNEADALRARNTPAAPAPLTASQKYELEFQKLQNELSSATPEQAPAIARRMANLAQKQNGGPSLADLSGF